MILSKPLIASRTTAFIQKSVIGECLHSIEECNGTVVSVTTFGFITNLPNLEDLIKSKFIMNQYKIIRKELSDDDTGLELNNRGKGYHIINNPRS
jgi:hypothetical protein